MNDKEFEELRTRFEANLKKGRFEYFDVDDLIDLIDWYIFEERDDEAAATINYALRFYPTNNEVRLMQARLCLCKDDFEGAEKIVLSLPTTCDAPDYSLILGELLLREDKINEALLRYERALIVSGDSPEAYASAINAFSTYGHLSLAEEWMNRALHCWPDEIAVIEAAALCCSILNQHDKAITYANRLVDDDPYSIRAWGLLGDVCHDAAEYDDALEAYGYLLAIRPNYHIIDQNIADCHYARGEWVAARDLYARALDEQNADVDYVLGRLALCEANLGNDREFMRLTQLRRIRDLEN